MSVYILIHSREMPFKIRSVIMHGPHPVTVLRLWVFIYVYYVGSIQMLWRFRRKW